MQKSGCSRLCYKKTSIDSNTLIRDSNTNDLVEMELLNRNFNAKVTIAKNQDLAFVTLINKGKEEFNVILNSIKSNKIITRS